MISPYAIPGIELKNVNMVEHIALQRLGLTPLQIRQQTRKRPIVIYRQIVIYFLYKYTDSTKKKLAPYFHFRNHSTIFHACKCVNNMIDTKDWEYYNIIQDIEEDIIEYFNNKDDGHTQINDLN